MSSLANLRIFRSGFSLSSPKRPRNDSPRRRNRTLVLDWLENRDLMAVGFAASNRSQSGYIPPDSMGAVGPNHFVELINGTMAIFNKSGALQLRENPDVFFSSVRLGGAFDPRILYDRESSRWFATALEFGAVSGQNNDVLMAVSKSSDPTWNTSTGSPTDAWNFYRIDVSVPNGTVTTFTDYSTLGVDTNGVYFGMRYFPSTGSSYAKIAATPKAPLLAASPSLGTLTVSGTIADMYSTPQPATNFDPVASTDPFYFVSSSTAVYANVNYRKVTWSGGVPSFSSTSVVVTPAFAPGTINAPALGSTTPINTGDMRLQMALVRDGKLWTARQVAVDAAGGSSAVTRTAVEWLNFDTSGSSLSLIQSGRIFDNAATNPMSYYYPSLVVTGQGIMRIAFSGSSAAQYVGAYSSFRLSSDTAGTTSAPVLIKAGENSYTSLDSIGRNRWGDYSFTSVDPNDDMTAWTIQEYATATANRWGTWVQSFDAPAPTMNDPAATVVQGTTAATLNLTGTWFYNPGPGFPNQLSVAFSGTGISNVVATYNSPTSVTVTYDVAANATPGARNITLTNPDGQSVTVTGGLTVQALTTVANVTSTSANGTYGTGSVIPITVTFSAPVNVTGTPRIQLNSGATVYANYLSGSGTNILTFQYTVGAGQSTADLDYVSTTALTLNGGTIIDGNSNAAVLTLTTPGTTGSLGFNKNIVIDAIAPTVTSYKVLFGTKNYELIGSTRVILPWQITGIQVTFSEPIPTANAASLSGLSATGLSGLGTSTLTWALSPLAAGNIASLLLGTGANAIKDAAGNALYDGTGFAQNFKVLYGDFNQDGVVTSADMVGVNAAIALAYNIFADINGDGVVDIADVQVIRTRNGKKLV